MINEPTFVKLLTRTEQINVLINVISFFCWEQRLISLLLELSGLLGKSLLQIRPVSKPDSANTARPCPYDTSVTSAKL